MSPLHNSALVRFVAVFWLYFTLCGIAAAGPVNMTSSGSTTLETSQNAITLHGTVTSEAPIASLHWVNQFEQRGVGTYAGSVQAAVTWTAPNIALRHGINLITITVVDTANHSASLHFAINNKSGAVAPSLPIGTGYYQNRPIVYQSWKGQAVVEGDMIVSLSAPTKPDTSKTSVAPKIVSPDGLGINYTANLWPVVNGVHQVPYIVTGTSTTALTSALSLINQSFPGLIQFVAWSNQANYVNIAVESGGSTEGYSNVGMVGGGTEQTLSCGSGCDEATWLHEMGHTVGLYHEHQRPDRASYLTLNLQNADLPNVPGNFTLFSYDYQTIGLYDYASVMHYCAFCFSKAGLPVLESIPAGIPLSNTAGYSAGDIDQIERLYGATPSKVTITTNPAGLQFVVDGTTYTAPQSFSFVLNSTHTLSLPTDPQYTNPNDGSTYAFGNWNDLGARSHSVTITAGSGTLASPATAPAVTVYEANFIRLQPFSYASAPVSPAGSGTLAVSPTPLSEYGGTFFTDRTLVSLSYSSNAGYDFFSWNNLPFPQSDNPHAFYIQAPETSAQALFEPTSSPVTIVGESITGPNTWNPGLVGYVDGTFTYLPSGFTPDYNGTTWNAGTSHSVTVNQTQSPVTLNVYYNWNSWSDGGATTHNITQPSTGSQTVSASFTPFYASYTVPPALGASGASCAGGVATSPAGTAYSPDIFDFYQDGTSVTTTATVNSAFPAMLFAGWTGSLSGTANPQTTTIHDQFVPTANFNLTSAPLTIGSLSPASAVTSANGTLNVTINGTGFTSNDTFAYYNGSYRPITFLSSTQITLQLQAGDLATVGGQDIYVGNYTTNASNTTCSVGAETSFTVAATAPGPTGTAVYSGTDTATKGTWTGVYGANGYEIINDATQLPTYASLGLSGGTPDTWAASTTDPRALQTASGAPTRIASTYYAASTVTMALNLTDGAVHRVALYLLDWADFGRTESVSILDANTGSVLGTQTYTNFNNGVWSVWNLSGKVVIQVKSLTSGANVLVSGIFFDPVAAATASYLGSDTTSEGTWTGTYGADGYLIANDATQSPSYATVSVSDTAATTWAASSTDPRALQTASGAATRIASAYYATTTVTFNVNLTDGNSHRVALYLLDWTAKARSQSVSILDANSSAVLSTQTFSSFSNGVYGVWNIRGHVLIQVTLLGGGPNSVVSGIFFGAAPSATATYIGEDTSTEGTWSGAYGSNGYAIANDAAQLPSYATLSFSGDSLTTWAASSTDPRALQTASGATTRIASAYYAASTFSININLTDGNTHQISLYLLDWTKLSRVESVSILDANSNAILNTQSFSSFGNGVYGLWDIKGHVVIQVTLKSGGPNAVTSGVFFDPT